MATAVKANTEKNVQKVTVFLPKIAGEDTTVFVGLNGKAWQIPRGKKVEVPAAVAEILNAAERNRQQADEYADTEKNKMKTVQGAPN